jgi:hypothetical protein
LSSSRNPSIAFYRSDGFREELNPSYELRIAQRERNRIQTSIRVIASEAKQSIAPHRERRK